MESGNDPNTQGQRPVSGNIWGWKWSWISLVIIIAGFLFLILVGPKEEVAEAAPVPTSDTIPANP